MKYKITNDFEAFSSKVDDLICDLEEGKENAILNIKTFIFNIYKELKGGKKWR